MFSKSELRLEIKKRWKNQSAATLAQRQTQAVTKLTADPEFLAAKTVGAYWPQTGHELEFMQELRATFREKDWYLPRIENQDLRWEKWTDCTQHEVGQGGISQPQAHDIFTKNEFDLVLVPAVAADQNGNRLGRGGGFYDRWLLDFCGRSLVVLPDWACVSQIPTESHDQKVDRVISISAE